MRPLKLLVTVLLAFLSIALCTTLDADADINADATMATLFYDARTNCDGDAVLRLDTTFDYWILSTIKSVRFLEQMFSSLAIIPVMSFLALGLLHKSEFDARTATSPASVAISTKTPNWWVYVRPFVVATAVLCVQKIFLYSIMFYPMSSSIKERIQLMDPLIMRPDQYLCYIMAYSISQSIFSSIMINSFPTYVLACGLWLLTRRVIRDIYLYLPKTERSFMFILSLTGLTSYVYSNGGPLVFCRSLVTKRKASTEQSLSKFVQDTKEIDASIAELADIVEHVLNFLTHMINSIQVQAVIFGVLFWHFSVSILSSSGISGNAKNMTLWWWISFFREDIKIYLPFYLVKWVKLLPLSLTNTALPVVRTIGESLFFLTVYLCMAVVTHADENLQATSPFDGFTPLTKQQPVPLGV